MVPETNEECCLFQTVCKKLVLGSYYNSFKPVTVFLQELHKYSTVPKECP